MSTGNSWYGLAGGFGAFVPSTPVTGSWLFGGATKLGDTFAGCCAFVPSVGPVCETGAEVGVTVAFEYCGCGAGGSTGPTNGWPDGTWATPWTAPAPWSVVVGPWSVPPFGSANETGMPGAGGGVVDGAFPPPKEPNEKSTGTVFPDWPLVDCGAGCAGAGAAAEPPPAPKEKLTGMVFPGLPCAASGMKLRCYWFRE
jgi:hypothetical protein